MHPALIQGMQMMTKGEQFTTGFFKKLFEDHLLEYLDEILKNPDEGAIVHEKYNQLLSVQEIVSGKNMFRMFDTKEPKHTDCVERVKAVEDLAEQEKKLKEQLQLEVDKDLERKARSEKRNDYNISHSSTFKSNNKEKMDVEDSETSDVQSTEKEIESDYGKRSADTNSEIVQLCIALYFGDLDYDSGVNVLQTFLEIAKRRNAELESESEKITSEMSQRIYTLLVTAFSQHEIPDILSISHIHLVTSSLSLPYNKIVLGSNMPFVLFEQVKAFISDQTVYQTAPLPSLQYASEQNSRALNLALYREHSSIYHAVSTLYFNNEQMAVILRLTVFYVMQQDQSFERLCKKYRARPQEIKLQVLTNDASIHPAELEILSRVLQRRINLFVGSLQDSSFVFSFGKEFNGVSVNVLELDSRFISLIPTTLHVENCDAHASLKHIVKMYKQCEILEMREFAEIFTQQCSFCRDFDIDLCPHFFDMHSNSLEEFEKNIIRRRYGVREVSMIQNRELIDWNLAKSMPDVLQQNFLPIQTPGFNHCFYNAVSYCLFQSFDLGFALRRAVGLEYKIHPTIYKESFKEILTEDELKTAAKQFASFKMWAISPTQIIMSKIISRKIVTFTVPTAEEVKSGMQFGWITYDLGSPTSHRNPPIFLILRGKHFQPLIPKDSENVYVPEGKDGQFKRMKRNYSKILLHQEHPYFTSGKIENCGTENSASDHLDISDKQKVEDETKLPLSSSPVEPLVPPEPKMFMDNTDFVPKEFEVSNFSFRKWAFSKQLSDSDKKEFCVVLESNGEPIVLNTAEYNENVFKNFNITQLQDLPSDEQFVYKIFVHAVVDEFAKIKEVGNEDIYIRVFLQRSSFDDFWSKKVKILKPNYSVNSSRQKQRLDKLVKRLLKIQETEKGRQVVVHLMNFFQFKENASKQYNYFAPKIFEQTKKHGKVHHVMSFVKSVIPIGKKAVPRTYPEEYDLKGIEISLCHEKTLLLKKEGIHIPYTKFDELRMLYNPPGLEVICGENDDEGKLITENDDDVTLLQNQNTKISNKSAADSKHTITDLESLLQKLLPFKDQIPAKSFKKQKNAACDSLETAAPVMKSFDGKVMSNQALNDMQLQNEIWNSCKHEFPHTNVKIIATQPTETTSTKNETIDNAPIEEIVEEEYEGISRYNDITQASNEVPNTQESAKFEEILEDKLGITADISLGFSQLHEMCNIHHWLETDQVEFLTQMYKEKTPESSWAVTRTTMANRQEVGIQNGIRLEVCSSSSSTDATSVFDALLEKDYHQNDVILHPLYVSRHWMCIKIDKAAQKCTIYDSLSSRSSENDIRINILPKFLPTSVNLSEWTVEYDKSFPVQTDGSSCGMFTVLAIKDLLKNGSTSNHGHMRDLINDPKEARMKLVREILSTTHFGKLLLEKAGPNNEILESILEKGKNYFRKYSALNKISFPIDIDTTHLPKRVLLPPKTSKGPIGTDVISPEVRMNEKMQPINASYKTPGIFITPCQFVSCNKTNEVRGKVLRTFDSTSFTTKEDVVDAATGTKINAFTKILHPIRFNERWCLLDVDYNKRELVVNCSGDIGDDVLGQVRLHVLPKFVTTNTDLGTWKVKCSKPVGEPKLSISCDETFVLNKAKEILMTFETVPQESLEMENTNNWKSESIQFEEPIEEQIPLNEIWFELDESAIEIEYESLDDYSDTDHKNPESDSESGRDSDKDTSDEMKQIKEVERRAKAIGISDKTLGYVPPTKFELDLNSDEVEALFDFSSGCFRTSNQQATWVDIISDKIKTTQGVCSFNAIRSPNTKKANAFAELTGHCGCGLIFKGIIKRVPVKGIGLKISFSSFGSFRLIQTKYCGRKVKGNRREATKRSLLANMPIRIEILNMSEMEHLHLLHQNYSHYSLRALQQIKHEMSSEDTKYFQMKEDIEDFANECVQKTSGKEVKGFIQNFSFKEDNIFVHLYTEASLRLLVSEQNSGGVHLSIDATGNLATGIGKKQFLYYLLLAHTSGGLVFPVAASVSMRGRGSDVAELVSKVRAEIKTLFPRRQKAIANVAIVDFSIPLITGALVGLNTQELKDYTKMVYELLRHPNKTMDSGKTVLFLCTSHLLKSFSRQIEKKIPKSDSSRRIKRLGKLALSLLQSSSDLDSYITNASIICETFSKKNINPQRLEENEQVLLSRVGTLPDDNEICEELLLQEEQTESEETRKSSIFYRLFHATKNRVLSTENPSDEENPYFAPQIISLMEDFYVPYASLFCSFMLARTGRHTQGSVSNSVIESEFRIIKVLYHSSEKTSLNVFLRRHYKYFNSRLLQTLKPQKKTGNKNVDKSMASQNAPQPTQATQAKDTSQSSITSTDVSALNDEETEKLISENFGPPPLKKKIVPHTEKSGNSRDALNKIPEEAWARNQKKEKTHIVSKRPLPPTPIEAKHSSDHESDMDVDEILAAHSLLQLAKADAGAHVDSGNPTVEIPDLDGCMIVWSTGNPIDFANFVSVDHFLTFKEMDYFLQNICNSTATNVLVTHPHLLSKSLDLENQNPSWIKNSKLQGSNLLDTWSNDVYATASIILHPLYLATHWALVVIDYKEKTLVLHDTYNGNKEESTFLTRAEMNDHIIPTFVERGEESEWQTDIALQILPIEFESTSGIFVISLAKTKILGVDDFDYLSNEGILEYRSSLGNLSAKSKEDLNNTSSGNTKNTSKSDMETDITDDYESTAVVAVQTLSMQPANLINPVSLSTADIEVQKVLSSMRFEDLIRNRHQKKSAADEFSRRIQDLINQDSSHISTTEISTADSIEDIGGKLMFEEILRRKNAGKFQKKPKKAKKPKQKNPFIEELGWTDYSDLESIPSSESETDLYRYAIPFYEEKEKLYNNHSRNVRRLTVESLTEEFIKIVPELEKICWQKRDSLRLRLFLAEDWERLQELSVSDPFTNRQDTIVSYLLIDHMQEFLRTICPNHEKLMTTVMMPEALLLIYANVNNIPLNLAEKELLYQAKYDGDINERAIQDDTRAIQGGVD